MSEVAELPSGSPAKSTEQRMFDLFAAYGMVVVLVLVLVIAFSLNQNFFSFGNVRNIFAQNAAVGMVAIGATFVIIGGGFDLSAGAMYALGAVVYAKLATMGIPVLPSMLLALMVGCLLGLANGVLINFLNVNPLVATLGSASMITGLAFIISDSAPIMARSVEGFDTLGRDRLFDITYSVYLLIATFLVMSFVLHKTTWGRCVYAIGGNREAAYLAGMRTTAISVSTYVLSGFFSVLGGILIASRTNVGQANLAGDVSLNAIAIVIIGGTTLFGGEGALWRTLIGLLILATLRNVFDTLSLSNASQLFAQGAILVIAVAMDAYVRSRRS
ncbi:ABC transporter permease [Hoeflea sp.]|uniref:ABC transporter permease n=1 Tax=Hoeflea sp. TaxID=1940281 RepID=UPI003B015565